LLISCAFYDASYLYIAKSRNVILITEDGELLEKANREGNHRGRLLRARNLLHKVKAH